MSKYLDELYLLKSGTGGGFRYIDEVTSLKMVGQEQPMSCAAACIRQIAKDNGVVISEEIARKAAKTDGFVEGTDVRDIGLALEEIIKNKNVYHGFTNIDVKDYKEAAKIVTQVAGGPWIATIGHRSSLLHTVIVDVYAEFRSGAILSQLNKFQKDGLLILKGKLQGSKYTEYFIYFEDMFISYGAKSEIFSSIVEIISIKGTLLKDRIISYLGLVRSRQTMVHTSAKLGSNATENAIKYGTVKMKLHPDYPVMMEFLEQRNVKIVEISDISESVGYTETRFFDISGRYLITEKMLDVHPEIRFLDLEHEIDHILQFETNLQGDFGTRVVKELSLGRLKDLDSWNLGYTNRIKKYFLEYEVRLKEYRRLQSRDAPDYLLEEHLEGINDHKSKYYDERSHLRGTDKRRFLHWKEKYFPNFNETINP